MAHMDHQKSSTHTYHYYFAEKNFKPLNIQQVLNRHNTHHKHQPDDLVVTGCLRLEVELDTAGLLGCPAAFFCRELEEGRLALCSLNESLLLLADNGEFLNDGMCSVILFRAVGVEFLLPALVVVVMCSTS